MRATSIIVIDVLIAGGGPAGMMAGLLFSRAGVRTLVLEKHRDFLRDFRGDTVHPSTLAIFDELGLAQKLLALPHDEVRVLHARIGKRSLALARFDELPTPYPFIALMPQWDLLDFVAAEARAYPAFALRMECEATELIFEHDRVAGVRTKDGEEIRSRLVIAADGRTSVLRRAANLPLEDLAAPIDVMWFRVPKERTKENETGGTIGRGTFLALIDRGDYWQCAFVLAKGTADRVRARGLDSFRAQIARAAPQLVHLDAISSWNDVKLLSVSLDRLKTWSRPGFLAIGDAAHAMSPVGGVGINLAIQDAVATANLLAEPLMRGDLAIDELLPQLQDRRMFPTRAVQSVQRAIHRFVLDPVLGSDTEITEAPLPFRVLDRIALLQRIPAALVGIGVRPEHIRSPRAGESV